MTKEDKEILLKDLCARLPYMPMIKITYQQQGIKGTDEGSVSCDFIEKIVNDLRNGVITDMQIYLRPLSSMTQEECTQLFVLLPKHYVIYQDQIHNLDENGKILPEHIDIIVDFYNSHHLDWRGLIPKGLALEAPKEMYDIK